MGYGFSNSICIEFVSDFVGAEDFEGGLCSNGG